MFVAKKGRHYQIEYPETIEEGGQMGVVDIWAKNKTEAENIAKERMGTRPFEVVDAPKGRAG
jgi:hypothetical protein